jgi:HEXXH motif-containing protein
MAQLFHSVPRNSFDELARGGGGPAAVRVLASGQFSKHLHLVRGVLNTAVKAGHRQAAATQAGFRLLADAQRHDSVAVQSVVSYPSVGAWALRTLRALRGGPTMAGAEPERLRAVAAAAAIRAGLPAEIEILPTGGLVSLPSLGAAPVDGESAVVRSTADGAEILSSGARTTVPSDPNLDAPGWLAARRLCFGSLDVLIDDVDPFRMPAESMVARRLGTADFSNWTTLLREAWTLLVQYHPDLAAELAPAIRAVVPLVMPSEGQISSSAAEAFGAVALSRSPDARTLAVTLVHEVQHLKLSALLNIVTLTLPDDGRRFYAPWRDDPRPACSLLQGAYAYVGVSRFWRRQRQLDRGDAGLRANAEFARWRAAALGVVGALQGSGLLTGSGTDFARGMANTLQKWQAEIVPREAQRLADREAKGHLARWTFANGPSIGWSPH